MNILIVIPARGGSKGIPRKNLRALNGKPLIYYSIKTALSSQYKPDVYVSTDDEEIGMISKKFGAKVFKRDPEYAKDSATLDPVIYEAYEKISKKNKKTYDIIVTLQPTSPLLRTSKLDAALDIIINNNNIDTVISAKEDTHLTWRKAGDKFVANYEKRVNRQYLPQTYRETGGVLITRNSIISKDNRIGKSVELFVLSGGESIDIDSFEDWNLCEYYLTRKNIVFVLTGYPEVGLGHIYRALILANNLVSHHLYFLVDRKSKLGYEKLSENNYSVFMQQSDNIIDDILKFKPDVVINDILDTEEDYISALKNEGIRVINFEDMGSGSKYCDAVINALYSKPEFSDKHYFGHKYFCAKDEFILTKPKVIIPEVKNVLITFGGTDPNNYTLKVLESIYDFCQNKNIALDVILGMGYNKHESLNDFKNISLYQNINNISDFMYKADIIFSSAGRTVYEIACIGVPTIVMAQNERELTHFFASAENGFINMGIAKDLDNSKILYQFEKLISNYNERKYINERMLSKNLKKGKERVIKLINNIIGH